MSTDVGNDVAVYEFMLAYDKFKLAEENYKASRISTKEFEQARSEFMESSKHSDQVDLESLEDQNITIRNESKLMFKMKKFMRKFNK